MNRRGMFFLSKEEGGQVRRRGGWKYGEGRRREKSARASA